MEILYTGIEPPSVWPFILGALLIIAAGFALKTGIKYLRWKVNSTSILFFLAFFLLLVMGVAIIRNNIGLNRTIYNVMITDEKALQEVKEDYTVLEQTGVIYTVKEKKWMLKQLTKHAQKEPIYEIAERYGNNNARNAEQDLKLESEAASGGGSGPGTEAGSDN